MRRYLGWYARIGVHTPIKVGRGRAGRVWVREQLHKAVVRHLRVHHARHVQVIEAVGGSEQVAKREVDPHVQVATDVGALQGGPV